MPIDQATARENARRFATLRGLTLKDLAERAGLSASAVYNWQKRGSATELGPKALASVAKALNVPIEQLFYNAGDAPPTPPTPTETPPSGEDWRAGILTIERYIRSIEDPAERIATVRRLLAIAESDVAAYERSSDRSRANRAADPGTGPTPRTPASRPRRT